MKRHREFLLFVFLLLMGELCAQKNQELIGGKVSYITSQHVYVRFNTTNNIQKGDTLYTESGQKLVPALIVNNLSSTSCVCTMIGERKFKTSDPVVARINKVITPVIQENLRVDKPKPLDTLADPIDAKTDVNESAKQNISGRIGISSYSAFSNSDVPSSQRMRYTLLLNAKNISDSPLSAETYISFVHRSRQWESIKANVFNGLKIYNLALKYQFSPNLTVWAGRKINPKIANMGAVDGVQAELKTHAFTFGILAGARPDYLDYSFDFSLLQYGMFVYHEPLLKKGVVQSTFAMVEQRNSGYIDRRFAYFQHYNALNKSVSFYGTAEFDVYKKVVEIETNTPRLSALYLSLRYKVSAPLWVSMSYSTRQNIIYYETYKNFIDRLLEEESRQGYQLQINYRPMKKLSLGVTGGYRFRKSDERPTKNLYSYASYSQIPGINTSATLSATFLETSYLNGSIYGLTFSRNIYKNKITSSLGYRYVDYRFSFSDFGQKQHLVEISMNCKLLQKLSCGIYYEVTFEKDNMLNRLNLQLVQRF